MPGLQTQHHHHPVPCLSHGDSRHSLCVVMEALVLARSRFTERGAGPSLTAGQCLVLPLGCAAGQGGDAAVVRAMGGWGRLGAVGTCPGTATCSTVLQDTAGSGAGTPSCPLQHHTSYMSSLNAFLLVFFGRPLH